ncbi:MAG: hypothetical protein NVS3B21_32860 [Acidimicrobiales bacterium]
MTQRALLVRNLLEDTRPYQTRQSGAQNVSGNAQAFLEVIEAAHAEECVTDDQHRPPLADNLEALGDGAVHCFEARPLHRIILVGCVMELNGVRIVR